MRLVRRSLAFLADFVIGDDWRLAAGAVVALGGVAALVAVGVNAWWFAPLAALGVLWAAVRG